MVHNEPKEKGNGTGQGEVVQPHQGFWLHYPNDGARDVFLHITTIQAAGLQVLNDGIGVAYEVAMERGKATAINLILLGSFARAFEPVTPKAPVGINAVLPRAPVQAVRPSHLPYRPLSSLAQTAVGG